MINFILLFRNEVKKKIEETGYEDTLNQNKEAKYKSTYENTNTLLLNNQHTSNLSNELFSTYLNTENPNLFSSYINKKINV